MLNLILFGLICWLAYKNNPDKNSFLKFMKNTETGKLETTKISKWIPKFAASAFSSTLTIDCDHKDFGLFSLCTVLPSRSAVYLGVFGQWFQLSSKETSTNTQNELLEIAHDFPLVESEKELAIQAKIRKDYRAAYSHFLKAASSLSTSSSKFTQIEAAQTYEEAAKMAKQDGNLRSGIFALSKAAQYYEYHDLIRAARVHDLLGDTVATFDHELAVNSYLKASEYYERENDGYLVFLDCFLYYVDIDRRRSLAVLEKLGHLYACKDEFAKAADVFQRLFKSDDSAFKRRNFLVNISLCLLVSRNYADLKTFMDSIPSEYPSLEREREFLLISSILQALNIGSCDMEKHLKQLEMNLRDKWQFEALKSLKEEADNLT